MFLLLWGMTACSDFRPSRYIEPEFLPYVQRFESETGWHVDVAINLVSLPAGTLGECVNNDAVLINSMYWDTLTEASKEQLIYHELGHCVARLPHRVGFNIIGCPLSIMSPTLLPDMCYLVDREKYVAELHWHSS